MTEALEELTAAEGRLLDQLPVAKAEADGIVYAKYASVAEGYAMLAVNGDQESLKRLVFLWWYSAVEPPYLSGLRDFPPGSHNGPRACLRSR